MVQAGGLETPTSGSTDRRSNQLSYACTSGRKLGGKPVFGKAYNPNAKGPDRRSGPSLHDNLVERLSGFLHGVREAVLDRLAGLSSGVLGDGVELVGPG